MKDNFELKIDLVDFEDFFIPKVTVPPSLRRNLEIKIDLVNIKDFLIPLIPKKTENLVDHENFGRE